MTTPMTSERLANFTTSSATEDEVRHLIRIAEAAVGMVERPPVHEDYDEDSNTLDGLCSMCGGHGNDTAVYNEETEEMEPVAVNHLPGCGWVRLVEVVSGEPAAARV